MAADLRKLNELGDLTVAAGDPDPRGWDVEAADGRDIGRVKDLIVDTEAMRARYLDVEVNPGLVRSEDRHLLVPTESIVIGDRERTQHRISVPLRPESIAAVAQAGDAPLPDRPASSAEWRPVDRDACTVRFTRGGSNG